MNIYGTLQYTFSLKVKQGATIILHISIIYYKPLQLYAYIFWIFVLLSNWPRIRYTDGVLK